MRKPVVEVQVRAVATASGGCAVFLGNEDKVFVVFVEQSVGAAIARFMQARKTRSDVLYSSCKWQFIRTTLFLGAYPT
jgi:hypothetical protein